MSAVPAKVFHLPGGTLAPGSAADVCVLDVTAPWVVRSAEFQSKSRNTPFAGRELVGRAVVTLVAGRVAFEREARELR
jgi:dihydroorotase